jgi:hypothetical protein
MLVLLLLMSTSWAQESGLTITDVKVEPGVVNPGGKVLISCRVSHSKGPMVIERVAVTTSFGEWNVTYPSLYDDGTQGDSVGGDGIYSLLIKVPDITGEGKVVFHAADKEGNETESESTLLTLR